MKALAVVVAADEACGIGRGGDLPWRLPGDMAHFRELTRSTRDDGKQNAVLMGRRTWESIPRRFRPLGGRRNIVLSRDPALALPAEVLRAGSMTEALVSAEGDPSVERVFAIGGAAVYEAALGQPSCRVVYLTRILGRYACDTFLAPLPADFALESAEETVVENGVSYRFEVWRRG